MIGPNATTDSQTLKLLSGQLRGVDSTAKSGTAPPVYNPFGSPMSIKVAFQNRPAIQRYQSDLWAQADDSVANAQVRRNRLRQTLTSGGWESKGLNHVSAGTLEYLSREGRKIIRLGAYVSGNPKDPEGGSWYERQTRLHKDLNNSECSEIKVLASARRELQGLPRPTEQTGLRPTLYLVTEWTPCAVCEGRITTFRNQFKDVEVYIASGSRYTGNNASTWNYSKADGLLQLTLPPIDQSQLSGRVFKERPASKIRAEKEESRSYNFFDCLGDENDSDPSYSNENPKEAANSKPRKRKKAKGSQRGHAVPVVIPPPPSQTSYCGRAAAIVGGVALVGGGILVAAYQTGMFGNVTQGKLSGAAPPGDLKTGSTFGRSEPPRGSAPPVYRPSPIAVRAPQAPVQSPTRVAIPPVYRPGATENRFLMPKKGVMFTR